jgi:cytoskeleton-associated protein 5
MDTSSSTSAGSSDGLPREDISAKITPTLLKNLGSPDWKVLGTYLVSLLSYLIPLSCLAFHCDILYYTYANWQVRLESIDAVNKIMEEAHKRIQPTGTGPPFIFISINY